MTTNRYELEREVLGGYLVYPGHPMATALMITHVFPDLDAASAKDGQYEAALTSMDVGGAGGAVSGGLFILHEIAKGKQSLESFEDRLVEMWEHERHPEERRVAGAEQGRLAYALLKERLPGWLGQVPSLEPSA